MNVVCFAGYSGAGKTTLITALIAALRQRGLRVSVIKHAHHGFEVDYPGKDTWRHREAGAFEVVAASDRRMALMREFEQPTRLGVHALIATLSADAHWVLVEGFKESNLPKIEVWRPPPPGEAAHATRYHRDPCVLALATSHPPQLPEPTLQPVFNLDCPDDIAQWLLANEGRFDYSAPSLI